MLIQPLIYDDESIEGYLIRLVQMNGYKEIDSMFKINYYFKSYIEEIRKRLNYGYLSYLPYDLAEMLIESPIVNRNNNRKVLSNKELLIGHGKKYYPVTRYCPYCLLESKYHRIGWSIIPEIICKKHNCFLLHNCPSCKAEISFITLVSGHCSECSRSICNKEVLKLDLTFISLNPNIVENSFMEEGKSVYLNHSQKVYRLKKWLMFSLLKNCSLVDNDEFNIDLTYKKLSNMVIVWESDLDKIKNFILFTEALLLDWPINLLNYLDNNLTNSEKKGFETLFFETTHHGKMHVFNYLSREFKEINKYRSL